MKMSVRKFCLFFGLILLNATALLAQQQAEPWRGDQLMSTQTLAEKIVSQQAGNLVILSIGPDAVIKGSKDIGPAEKSDNLSKLKATLKKLPKDKPVVIYCGCCPFDRCPNIRPAFSLLKEMQFKNAMLLDIPRNIKVDWLDKDYPVND